MKMRQKILLAVLVLGAGLFFSGKAEAFVETFDTSELTTSLGISISWINRIDVEPPGVIYTVSESSSAFYSIVGNPQAVYASGSMRTMDGYWMSFAVEKLKDPKSFYETYPFKKCWDSFCEAVFVQKPKIEIRSSDESVMKCSEGASFWTCKAKTPGTARMEAIIKGPILVDYVRYSSNVNFKPSVSRSSISYSKNINLGDAIVQAVAPPTYFCTGAISTHATLCTEDAMGLTANIAKTLVSSCVANTTKCEYACESDYHKVGNTCVADTLPVIITTPTEGNCGPAISKTYCSAPTSDLCSSGTPSMLRLSGTSWTWKCNDTSCSTQKVCSGQEVNP